jgi:CheY-like chemotaxis protein
VEARATGPPADSWSGGVPPHASAPPREAGTRDQACRHPRGGRDRLRHSRPTGSFEDERLTEMFSERTTEHAGQALNAVPERGRDIKTLTVDDHRSFREALRDLIAAAPGFVLVGQACSGEEAVRAVECLTPELVLMDVVMPGMGGIAAAQAIISRCPEVVVLLISVDDPALHPGALALDGAVACARKQDLRPRQLRQLWETARS